ncbi:uncharacterized protein LOC106171325 [Lingula anatina]|uniref:Uncharacterized protein LOC106171325 n=1 Tax=Lingula anatina TaxID=7574 RepID=A0A1S3J9J9_LINAN|nr:uncharacterized protein LOC106171325 [Lingula anatina]XP_013407081.1 uncharacterized protein LOC106171325 [Lingula anatina]|eukprot:XP_013407080.1 uncharacterized protein LOC106171325 [Lingula anatina]
MNRRNGRVVRDLAHELLSSRERQVLKDAIQYFQQTKSVPSLCAAMKKIITDPQRTLILVELTYMMPLSLQDDYYHLCCLEFPYYKHVLSVMMPEEVRSTSPTSMTIAQNETGSMKILSSEEGKTLIIEEVGEGRNALGEIDKHNVLRREAYTTRNAMVEKHEHNAEKGSDNKDQLHNNNTASYGMMRDIRLDIMALNDKDASLQKQQQKGHFGHQNSNTTEKRENISGKQFQHTNNSKHGTGDVDHTYLNNELRVANESTDSQMNEAQANETSSEVIRRNLTNVGEERVKVEIPPADRDNSNASHRLEEQRAAAAGASDEVDMRVLGPGLVNDIVVERVEGQNDLSDRSAPGLTRQSNSTVRSAHHHGEEGVQVSNTNTLAARTLPGSQRTNPNLGFNERQRSAAGKGAVIQQAVSNTHAHARGDIRKVVLHRYPGQSLGFCIRGGCEMGAGIFISEVDAGGQAETKGLLVGDRIVKVNETSFRKISHDEAVFFIKHSDVVKIYVTSQDCHKMPSIEEAAKICKEKALVVHADPDGWLGCSIRGGIDQGREVIISNVDPLSPAMRAGLRKGDRILKLNGYPVFDMTHMEVITLATSAPIVHLVVQPVCQRSRTSSRSKPKSKKTGESAVAPSREEPERLNSEPHQQHGEDNHMTDTHDPVSQPTVTDYSPTHLSRPEEIRRYEQHLERTPPVIASTPVPTDMPTPLVARRQLQYPGNQADGAASQEEMEMSMSFEETSITSPQLGHHGNGVARRHQGVMNVANNLTSQDVSNNDGVRRWQDVIGKEQELQVATMTIHDGDSDVESNMIPGGSTGSSTPGGSTANTAPRGGTEEQKRVKKYMSQTIRLNMDQPEKGLSSDPAKYEPLSPGKSSRSSFHEHVKNVFNYNIPSNGDPHPVPDVRVEAPPLPGNTNQSLSISEWDAVAGSHDLNNSRDSSGSQAYTDFTTSQNVTILQVMEVLESDDQNSMSGQQVAPPVRSRSGLVGGHF